MKTRVPIIRTSLIVVGLLTVATFVSVEQNTFAAQPMADAAHAAHVAAAASQADGQTAEAQLAEMRARIEQLEAIIQQQSGQSPAAGAMPMGAQNPPRIRPMPGMGSGARPMQGGMAGMDRTGGRNGGMGGDPAFADQLAELRGKMQRLEAIMQQQSGSTSGAMLMGGTPGMGSGTKPMQGGMAGMSGMGAGNPPSGGAPVAMQPNGGMGGMGGAASPPGGDMGMMANMMSMMANMMGGMGSGAPAAGAPMGGTAPGGGMGMMDMDKMEMAGMMGSMGSQGGSSMAMPSALPGFPGASHLYHVGATGFFLDHPQCIVLSTEQQMMLNQIKEQAALDKASASRSVQQAEQDLWTLTAADQPDNAQIQAKVAEIEKLKGDARLRFIGAIGRAANILNDEQRKSLTGFAPPVSAAPAAATPAAAPMAGGMSDM